MAEPGTYYIRARRLITGLRGDGDVIENAAVLVEGGMIVACGPAAAVPPPEESSVEAIVAANATVLPGLIDAHVHLTLRRGELAAVHMTSVSDEKALLRGAQMAGQVLRAGVTTVRDCGSRARVVHALRDGVREGLVAGPRILASGPPVTTTEGHLWPFGQIADNADEARRAVRTLVRDGADLIKLCATGGGLTPGSVIGRAQYTVEELAAVVAEAHRLGRHVAAHVHGTEGLRNAVAARVDTLEHCTWLDAAGTGIEFDEDVVREIAAQGLFANIASSPPRELVDASWRPGRADANLIARSGPGSAVSRWELAHRMCELGAEVLFSTDAIPGWWDDGHDLSYLAQVLVQVAGFAPLEVLRMITAVPARAIGLASDVGTVEVGKRADLLVVDGDPLTDITALHRVHQVFRDGVPILPSVPR